MCETVAFLILSRLALSSEIAREGIWNPSEEAKPITPPCCTGLGKHSCIVEYHKEPYSLVWSGSVQYPDLRAFPKDLDAHPLPQSEEMAKIWKSSVLVDFGSHAVIRASPCSSDEQEHDNQRFPIIKLAHSDAESLALIRNEIEILSDPIMRSLPTPIIDEQYITKDGIPVGFRMKTLFKVEATELYRRMNEVQQSLRQLHDAGFSHGDFSPSNVMKDGKDRITLIDFSHAGRIGEVVPLIIQRQGYCDDRYNADYDWRIFHRFFTLPSEI